MAVGSGDSDSMLPVDLNCKLSLCLLARPAHSGHEYVSQHASPFLFLSPLSLSHKLTLWEILNPGNKAINWDV